MAAQAIPISGARISRPDVEDRDRGQAAVHQPRGASPRTDAVPGSRRALIVDRRSVRDQPLDDQHQHERQAEEDRRDRRGRRSA